MTANPGLAAYSDEKLKGTLGAKAYTPYKVGRATGAPPQALNPTPEALSVKSRHPKFMKPKAPSPKPISFSERPTKSSHLVEIEGS